MKQRDHYIDVLKGSAMILVIWAHCGMPLGDIVNYFHMPLFFCISGFLFHDSDFKHFFIRKIRGLYIPFIIYEFLFLIFHNVFYSFNLYSTADWSWMFPIRNMDDFKTLVFHIMLFDNIDELLAPFWFVTCLFWAGLIYYALNKLIHNQYIRLLACFICLVSAFVLKRLGINLSWTYNFKDGISAIMLAVWAIGIGHVLKEKNALDLLKNYSVKKPIWEIIGIGILFGAHIFGLKGEMLTVSYTSYVLFSVCSITGILTWSMIWYRIYMFMTIHFKYGIEVVSSIGKNSFHYMAIQFLAMKPVSWLLLKMSHVHGNVGDSGIAHDIHGIYRVLGFLLTMIICYLFTYLKGVFNGNKAKQLIRRA